MTSAPPTRVWLIEDNAVFRRALARTLAGHPGLDCQETFSRCEDALAALPRSAPPEVILLDVGLPGMDGISAIPRLRELAPAAMVVILTVFEDEEKLVRAIGAGATGYLLKTASPDEIVRAIQEAVSGGAPINGRVARRVLETFARMVPARDDSRLTSREREILRQMAGGYIKKEIAARLGISIHTVDTHLRNIYAKLEVNTRTGAVAKAFQERLI